MASGLPSTLSSNDSSVIKPLFIPGLCRGLRTGYSLTREDRRIAKNSYHRRQVRAASLWTEANSCSRDLLQSLANILPSIRAVTSVNISTWQLWPKEPSLQNQTALSDVPAPRRWWPVMLSKPTPRRNGSLSPGSCLWKLNEVCSLTFSKCQKHQNPAKQKTLCPLTVMQLIYMSLHWRLSTPLWTRSVVSDSATPWTVARQAPLSMGFSRQDYCSGLPFPSPRKEHL